MSNNNGDNNNNDNNKNQNNNNSFVLGVFMSNFAIFGGLICFFQRKMLTNVCIIYFFIRR